MNVWYDQRLVAKLCMMIDTQVEGYQVTYGGKSGKMSVLCKDGIDLERYCRQEFLRCAKV